jgi:hypothetical protein
MSHRRTRALLTVRGTSQGDMGASSSKPPPLSGAGPASPTMKLKSVFTRRLRWNTLTDEMRREAEAAAARDRATIAGWDGSMSARRAGCVQYLLDCADEAGVPMAMTHFQSLQTSVVHDLLATDVFVLQRGDDVFFCRNGDHSEWAIAATRERTRPWDMAYAEAIAKYPLVVHGGGTVHSDMK